ncbi:MAG: glycosyltransferase [Candidatus Electrothrix sp. AR1]|nr:glycosyltransferase [Candidatus Electrothrix sp. AR1]
MSGCGKIRCENKKKYIFSDPIYSIITVSLNARQGIEKTARSISTQQCDAFEWIVIDGGSTDGTLQFLEREKGVNRLVSELDDGIYDAMNKGIQYARGSYCLFLNAGDLLYNSLVLERMKEYLTADLVVGRMQVVCPENPAKNGIRQFDNQDIRKKYLFSRSLPHPATLIKKSLFFRYGFYDQGFEIAGDHDFFARVLTKGASMGFAPFCVSVFSLDGISARMKGSEKLIAETTWIRERNFSRGYRLWRRIVDAF